MLLSCRLGDRIALRGGRWEAWCGDMLICLTGTGLLVSSTSTVRWERMLEDPLLCDTMVPALWMKTEAGGPWI